MSNDSDGDRRASLAQCAARCRQFADKEADKFGDDVYRAALYLSDQLLGLDTGGELPELLEWMEGEAEDMERRRGKATPPS